MCENYHCTGQNSSKHTVYARRIYFIGHNSTLNDDKTVFILYPLGQNVDFEN